MRLADVRPWLGLAAGVAVAVQLAGAGSRAPRHTLGAARRKKRRTFEPALFEPAAPTMAFEVIGLDVWGNRRDGFEVNDARRTGRVVRLPADATDDQIVAALKAAGEIDASVRRAGIEIDDDAGGTIYVGHKGRPEFQLERLRNDDPRLTSDDVLGAGGKRGRPKRTAEPLLFTPDAPEAHDNGAVRFFFAQGGYGTRSGETPGQATLRAARRLAAAVAAAEARDWTFEWHHEPHADLSDMEDEERARVEEVLYVVLKDAAGRVRAGLGMIIDPSRNYARQIEAELALEALTEDGEELGASTKTRRKRRYEPLLFRTADRPEAEDDEAVRYLYAYYMRTEVGYDVATETRRIAALRHARAGAGAEREAQQRGWRFTWAPDLEPDLDMLPIEERRQPHTVFTVSAHDAGGGEVVPEWSAMDVPERDRRGVEVYLAAVWLPGGY